LRRICWTRVSKSRKWRRRGSFWVIKHHRSSGYFEWPCAYMWDFGAFIAVAGLHRRHAALLEFTQIVANCSWKKSEVKTTLERTYYWLTVRVLLKFSAHDACHIEMRVELYELWRLEVNRALVLVEVEWVYWWHLDLLLL
jgi:hypothetical protein